MTNKEKFEYDDLDTLRGRFRTLQNMYEVMQQANITLTVRVERAEKKLKDSIKSADEYRASADQHHMNLHEQLDKLLGMYESLKSDEKVYRGWFDLLRDAGRIPKKLANTTIDGLNYRHRFEQNAATQQANFRDQFNALLAFVAEDQEDDDDVLEAHVCESNDCDCAEDSRPVQPEVGAFGPTIPGRAGG